MSYGHQENQGRNASKKKAKQATTGKQKVKDVIVNSTVQV